MTLSNYTSTWFVNNYIFMDRLAPHVRASHITKNIEEDILDSTRNVSNYINDRGGFHIIGWAKRGMIQDQGAAGVQQENQGQQGYRQPANQGNSMMENAEVQYHVVRYDPSNPENIDINQLNALKYTMGETQN
jgi:hypothetical protein